MSIKYKQLQRRNKKYKIELVKRATKEELIVKDWLVENKIKHIFQKGFLKPFHRIPDFYIPKRKIIIEIDGGYHINTKSLDDLKDKLWLRDRGMITIRITNDQVLNGQFKELLEILL